MELLVFLFNLSLVVGSSFGMIFSKNPVRVILWFLAFTIGTASIFFSLGAELLAGLQLIIYAVAIIIFYVLVITTIPWDKIKKYEGFYLDELIKAFPVVFIIFSFLAYLIYKGKWKTISLPQENNVVLIGKLLFTSYVIPFEIASFILLVAMIGAIIFGKGFKE